MWRTEGRLLTALQSLFVVGFIVTVLSAYQTYELAQCFEGGALSVVLDLVTSFPEDLVISLHNGRLSINAELPLIVPWPESWQTFVDRWGVVPYMAAFDSDENVDRQRSGVRAYMIFTERGIYVDQNVLETNIMHQPYYYQAYEDAEVDGQVIGDATITRELLVAVSTELVHDLEEVIGESIDFSLLVIVACIVMWAVTVTLWVYVFVTSVIGYIAFSVVSSYQDFSYTDVVKIAAHAQVPIWLATGVMSYFVGGMDFVLDIAVEASLLLVVLYASLREEGVEEEGEADEQRATEWLISEQRAFMEMQRSVLEKQRAVLARQRQEETEAALRQRAAFAGEAQ